MRSPIFTPLASSFSRWSAAPTPSRGTPPTSSPRRSTARSLPIPRPSILTFRTPWRRSILKCLEKDRSRRFKTAEEVLAELHRIENDLPTTERVTVKARSSVFAGLTEDSTREGLLGDRRTRGRGDRRRLRFIVPRKPPRPQHPAAPRKPTLAVLFFDNRTNDPNLEFSRRDLCTKFISSIRQLSPAASSPLAGTAFTRFSRSWACWTRGNIPPTISPRSPRTSDATHILTGQLMKVGETWQIYYELEDAAGGAGTGAQTKGGATLASVNARSGYKNGKPEDLDTIVASLAEQVVRDLRIPVSGRVKAHGSSSGPAMQNYAEARDIEFRANLSQNRRKEMCCLHIWFKNIRRR